MKRPLNNSQRFAKAAINAGVARQIQQGKMSVTDLERFANCLSNFDGNDLADYDGGELDDQTAAFLAAYDGSGDDLVDFEGQTSTFRQETEESMTERVYSFTVVNGNATDETFYLISGFSGISYTFFMGQGTMRPPLGQLLVDGVNYSTNTNPLTVTGAPKPFEWLYNFLLKNPTRVVGMKLTSTVATQLQTSVRFERQSPFKDLQTKTLQLANYTNEHTYQDKTVTVPVPFQMDDQMRISFTVKAASTLTITLYCGAVANMGKFLEKRAAKANHTKKIMPKSYNPIAIKDRVILNAGKEPLMLGI